MAAIGPNTEPQLCMNINYERNNNKFCNNQRVQLFCYDETETHSYTCICTILYINVYSTTVHRPTCSLRLLLNLLQLSDSSHKSCENLDQFQITSL